MKQLPIFRLGVKERDPAQVFELGRRLFSVEESEVDERGSRTILRSSGHRVEVEHESGGIWAADEARLWNPDEVPDLPKEDEAIRIGQETIQRFELLPELEGDPRFRLVPLSPGRTVMVTREGKERRREQRALDVQARFGVRVVVEGDQGAEEIPVVGGGGKFNITLGDKGRIIGYSGVWRPIESGPLYARALSREETDKLFEEATSQLHVESYDVSLAYYAAPSTTSQTMLYPVWLYRASAIFGKERIPLRVIAIPASEYGPFHKPPSPQPGRARRRIDLSALTLPRRSYLTALLNPFEAGTSWIGLSGGLAGSQNNAKGFVDELQSDGWRVNFNWGDANAWESDWRRNDDTWVDNADFVFYTGHANMNGWVLSNPDDGSLQFSETGTTPESPGDLWGQQDLEWGIIAACGPLQDELLSQGGGDVLDRWEGAFDGLHILMGYGAVTFDNEEEGKAVVEYAKDGMPLIDAWFRAAREIQPSTNGFGPPDGPDVWVGAMYVYRSGTTSPRNDHLWGHGSVSADPTSPNVQVCMWTTC